MLYEQTGTKRGVSRSQKKNIFFKKLLKFNKECRENLETTLKKIIVVVLIEVTFQ